MPIKDQIKNYAKKLVENRPRLIRGEAFRSSGWSGYDPKAPQFTAEQVRAERERYRAR